ncbi:T9SS type A sorting domain-containing protein [Bernardetia litoralis]|uniref:T9SS type A sorting domain-containing protein n=1 Tax=Bernardetia litoralis TaxID=999 RepID=UPI0002EC4C43|nr:T9SS type A sorting domain-containing protein [Bernardetia litoralis]
MKNLFFSCYQNKDFPFGKSLFLGGFDYIEPPYDCNGNDAGMGKIAVKDKEEINSEILLFPNPTNTEFSLKTSLNIDKIVITNSLGQILLTSYKKKSISIESLSTGIYFVTIKLQNGEVKIQKIIIN